MGIVKFPWSTGDFATEAEVYANTKKFTSSLDLQKRSMVPVTTHSAWIDVIK
jgi:hypothetical protein